MRRTTRNYILNAVFGLVLLFQGVSALYFGLFCLVEAIGTGEV